MTAIQADETSPLDWSSSDLVFWPGNPNVPFVEVFTAFTTLETTALSSNLFTVLNDPNGGAGFAVTAVDGSPTNIATQITLASGALLTVEPNGNFEYVPNHAF